MASCSASAEELGDLLDLQPSSSTVACPTRHKVKAALSTALAAATAVTRWSTAADASRDCDLHKRSKVCRWPTQWVHDAHTDEDFNSLGIKAKCRIQRSLITASITQPGRAGRPPADARHNKASRGLPAQHDACNAHRESVSMLGAISAEATPASTLARLLWRTTTCSSSP